MGDENPIRTLVDYSKPSHEGYRNTIELVVRNNMVPLRFDTIQLVQIGCSFHGLRSEDPNQHLKDFLKLVDSLDLDGGRLRKLRPDEAWAAIERLAQYEDEGLKKQKKDEEDERLLSIFKQIHINLSFLEAMIHMPKGAKVLKDLLSHKEKLKKVASSVKLSEEFSTVIQRSLP
ncbi:hypothetical protein Tco_0347178 [Tanacetum coccineum]